MQIRMSEEQPRCFKFIDICDKQHQHKYEYMHMFLYKREVILECDFKKSISLYDFVKSEKP